MYESLYIDHKQAKLISSGSFYVVTFGGGGQLVTGGKKHGFETFLKVYQSVHL